MNGKALRVSDYMTREPLSVTADTEVMRVVNLLVTKDVSGVPVVDNDMKLVGILTERDCIEVALQAGYFDEIGGTVEQFMTADVVSVEPDTPLMDIAEIFAHAPFRRCPVTEEGRLVGLICRRDILRALVDGAWFPDNA